jgi:hypothetical protein
MPQFRFTATVLEPWRLGEAFEEGLSAAVGRAGASDLRFTEDEEKPSVSFLLDALNEHAALEVGNDSVRSVVGGELIVGVTPSA